MAARSQGFGAPDPQRSFTQTHTEILRQDALAAAYLPGGILADIPPPLPQIDRWPPRYGYDDRALGVLDVLSMNQLYQDRRDAWSGGPHEWRGSVRMAENPF